MKKLKLFFALFAMLALGVGNAWGAEVTINFGSGSGDVNVNDFNISTTDTYGTTWSISTVATDKSFTPNANYSQIGASKKPATTITLTGTIVKACTINSISSKWGGFSGTAGNIEISVNGSSYATGKLNATNDVTVGATNDIIVAAGDKIVITVTNIAKGVKLYFLSYTYTESSGGGEPETPVVTIELDKTEATLNLEETLTLNATVENSEETIVWASDKESVATVSNGVVTAIGAGKANITATVEGVTATCVVTVKDPNAPAWTLVTDASTLKAGDKIVIAGTGDNSNYALSTEQKSNNRGAVAATKTDDKIEEVDNMQILTLETGTKTGTFAFNTGSGYLYAASSSSNYLKTQTINNDNGSWTIAIADGVATVVAQGTYTRNTMRYNYNNGSPLFAAYASSSTTGALVAIYTQAKPAGTPDAPTLTASQEFETETFTVEISAVDGATIHYTLDGSDPTEASTTYSAPFTVNATTTVKAIAVKDGVASNVATATYTKVSVIEKTCAEAAALCTSDESTDKYRVEGYVTAIETAYSAQYNNITVWMADTRNGGNVLQAFRATPTVDADKAVKVGDKIEVVGKLKLYNSTPEIVSGTYTITQLDPVYNVNITSEHGTATATPASAVEGTEITLSVEVESGWVFQSWTVTYASSNTIEVIDNKFTMPASDVTVVANYTESVAPDAVLKLSANGVVTSNTYKVGETVKLPETIVNDCVKMFVGWSTDANCATTPEYAPGADFELTAEEHTLYAVYGTQTGGGEGVLTKMTSTDAFANGDKVVIVAYGTQLGMYQETSGTTYVKYWELVGNEPTVAELEEKTIWDVEADGENWKIGDATTGYLYNASSNNLAVSTTNASIWTITWKENGFVFKSDLDRYMACRTDLTGSNKNLYRMNGTTIGNNGVYEMDVYKYTSSAPIYSDYSTTCAAAAVATVNSTSVTATAAGAEGTVTVTYENVNLANVAVALFNDEACTETFTAGWLTASIDADKNITYTVAENITYAERKAYIQLTAPETNGTTEPAKVVILVTQAGKDKVFASLAELVAADLTAGDEVTVTLNNDVIKEFYIYNSNRAGVVFDVQKDGKDIKIYFNNQTTIVDWAVGGKLSGTLTNVKWTTYSGAWQLAPANTWAWANLTYTEPKAVSTVVVSGAPTKTTYVDGEAFDPAGLTVTVNYNDATSEVNPTGVTFAVTPATLVKGQTSVSVTATFNSVTSAAYEVTDLTVNDIPTKTVAEFIAAEGGRCYLEGIVSGLTEGNSMKYGNFNLTDASGTIYVYGCLNAAGESQKFADLGVKNGDKIKVIADEYELYDGTKDEAKNVQYVSHISAASITVENITMEVEEVATISATLDPADAVVTYTIKENTENAISLSDNTITALAEGTATITATIAEGATYLGNSVDFTVTVGPKTESDEVVILAEYNGQWFAMKGAEGSGTGQLAALEVTYFNGTLYNVAEADKASITWTRTIVDGKATFVNNGKYLKGKDGNLSLVTTTDDNCKWTSELGFYTTGNNRTFIYREDYNFKNYSVQNVGASGYSGFPEVVVPVYATGDVIYTREGLTNRKFGTICLPYGSTEYSGATFFEIAYQETGKVYIDEVTTLEAGVPYIFQANSSTLTVTCEGEAVADAGSANGLYGTFTKIADVAAVHTDKDEYILTGGLIRKCELNCNVPANRAYIVLEEISTEQTPAPVNRRRVGMSVQGENETTGVEDIFTTESPAKVIENGQLIIIRGGVKYNVQGQKL